MKTKMKMKNLKGFPKPPSMTVIKKQVKIASKKNPVKVSGTMFKKKMK